jgi:hypothetical protein
MERANESVRDFATFQAVNLDGGESEHSAALEARRNVDDPGISVSSTADKTASVNFGMFCAAH